MLRVFEQQEPGWKELQLARALRVLQERTEGRVVRLQQSRREEVQSRPRHGETDLQQLVARRGQL